jgi:hypothetical protein
MPMTTIDLPPSLGLDLRSRRVVAAQIAFRLGPAAWAAQAYVSSAALHAPPTAEPRRPDVIVAAGEPPHDGVVRTDPLLVVALAGASDPQEWLRRGARTVWVLGADDGVELTAARCRHVTAGGALRVAATAITLTLPWRPGCEAGASSPVVREVG